MGAARGTLSERLWRRVEKTDACWLWQGSTRHGYGQIQNGRGMSLTHRLAYEELVGPIPAGLQLDHLCRVRNCVNPAHMEPVTQRENILRGEGFAARNAVVTHCPKGHEYSGANLRVCGGLAAGQRKCRQCHREAVAEAKARRRNGTQRRFAS